MLSAAGAAVEREAPRVAQPVGVDLPARARAAHERVRARDPVRVGARAARVDAQELAEQGAQRLGVAAIAVLVVAAAAVAGADVHQPVGPEDHQPAVVVGLGVLHAQDEPRAVRGGPVGARAAVLDDPLLAGAVGEVDVEAPAAGVVRREGHRQQPALAAGQDLRGDVQERPRQRAPAAHDHDAPALLDHEHAPAVTGRRGDVQRRGEAPDLHEPDAAPRLRRAGLRGGGPRFGGRRGLRLGRRSGGAIGPRVRAARGEDEGGRDEGEGGAAAHRAQDARRPRPLALVARVPRSAPATGGLRPRAAHASRRPRRRPPR